MKNKNHILFMDEGSTYHLLKDAGSFFFNDIASVVWGRSTRYITIYVIVVVRNFCKSREREREISIWTWCLPSKNFVASLVRTCVGKAYESFLWICFRRKTENHVKRHIYSNFSGYWFLCLLCGSSKHPFLPNFHPSLYILNVFLSMQFFFQFYAPKRTT